MASDSRNLYMSARAKVAEFRRLGYPDLVLQKTLSYLGATTGDGTWIRVRNALRDASDSPQEGAEAS